MGVAAASTTSSSFVAMMQVFTIPAAFLADSYLKRVYTVLFFAPIEILVRITTIAVVVNFSTTIIVLPLVLLLLVGVISTINLLVLLLLKEVYYTII